MRQVISTAAIFGCLCNGSASAQEQVVPVATAPIERVIVENYHVRPGADGQATLTTYRIFLDLPPAHALQVIYGDAEHTLRIQTEGTFYNTGESSVVYGDRLVIDPKNFDALALDSWLTIGMVGSKHLGVPRELDPDGSILECPRSEVAPGAGQTFLDPLCVTDGLALAPGSREVVSWKYDQGYLGTVKGGTILSNDIGWGMLGGMKGATEENIVLVAQITTTDPLHFTLNAQIGLPDGNYARVVWKDPQENEVLFEQLKFGELGVN